MRFDVTFLDAFVPQSSESRPNTAPAGTRTTSAAVSTPTPTSTSASTSRPAAETARPRAEGTSSSASASAPSAATNRSAQIQMSALTNILANLSGGNPSQVTDATGEAAAAAAKPSIDLYDIMNTEVN